MTRDERLTAANDFLIAIASTGRRFFKGDGDHIARFVLDHNNRVCLVDRGNRRVVILITRRSHWVGFSEGSGLKWLVEMLAEYINDGDTIPADCGVFTHWGYGDDAALSVIDAGKQLGIIVGSRTKPFTQYGTDRLQVVHVSSPAS